MTMFFDVPPGLKHMLADFEVYGMQGHSMIKQRYNIMLDNIQYKFEDDVRYIHGIPTCCEGASKELYLHGCFPRFPDRHFGDEVKVACDVIPPFNLGDSKVLLWNVADGMDFHRQDQPDWIFDEYSLYLPFHDQGLDAFHCLETFAGGFGGWKYGISFLMKECGIRCHTVAIEASLQAAQDYCMTHDAVLIEAMNCSPKIDLASIDKNIVLHADVESTRWWECVAKWRVDIMMVSAPCPPWTLAASGPGLTCDQGCLLPYTILLNRIFRPKLCLVEQVNGFSTHSHKQFCMATMKAVGLRLKWARVIDSCEWGCAKRLRWLAIMIRNNATGITETECKMWPQIEQLTPAKIDALFGQNTPQVELLLPSQLMLSCAKDATLLPTNMRLKLWNSSGDEILKSRCHAPDETVPTIMARYGQQHLIARHHMEGKGYFGSFVIDGDGRIRLLHPIEVGFVHLIHTGIFVSKDLHQAWTHLGNQITFPHATLVLANALNQLEQITPKLSIECIFEKMLKKIINTKNSKVYESKHGIACVDSTWNEEIWKEKLQKYDELIEAGHQFWLPENHVWTSDQGIMHVDLFLAEEEWSMISPNDTASIGEQEEIDHELEISPTMPIHPLIKIKVVFGDQISTFWIDPDVAVIDFERILERRCVVQQLSQQPDGCSMMITIMPEVVTAECIEGPIVIPCVHEGNLILCSFDPMQDPIQQLQQKGMPSVMFDQYGEILTGQKFLEQWLFLDFQMKFQPLGFDAAFLIAAFQEVQMTFQSESTKFENVIEIHGPQAARQIMTTFWASVFAQETLQRLAISIHIEASEHSTKVVYRLASDHMRIPPRVFAECLSTLASQRVLEVMKSSRGIDTTIKWFSKMLWKGPIDPMMNMLVISKLLQITQWPSLLGKEIRLIANGKQACNITVAELAKNGNSGISIHAVMQLQGGAGSKEAVRIHTRNSIAATLLELGYQLEWVSKTTEILIENATKKAIATSQLPPGKQRSDAIMALCQDCAITIPDKLTKEAIQVSKADNSQRRKRQVVQIQPEDYRIQPGFLLNQDMTNAVQVQQVRRQGTGVVLVDFGQATPWIQESAVISQDEHALLVVGEHKINTSLSNEIIHVPCIDRNNRPVILKCMMIQLGEKQVKLQTSQHELISEQDCTTISVTYWKDDWNPEAWTQILDNPFSFTKLQLKNQGLADVLEATWGKSVRHNNAPSVPHHASSLQIHGSVKTCRLKELLTASGFNRIWITPKDQSGRISKHYRIIWIDGTIAHLSSTAVQVKGCLGLVKNKNSLGLRFENQDYESAWTLIYPDREVPKQFDIAHLYKIEPLPFGCTGEMLTKWANMKKWPLKPLKALGATCWLVGAQTLAPDEIHTFNARPVLLKLLPPKNQERISPVIAGPKPLRSNGMTAKPIESGQQTQGHTPDPWASYTGPRLNASVPRDVTGPTEKKFQEQAERIAKVENAIEQLKNDTAKGFQQVEEREQIAHHQTQQAITSVKQDLECAFQNAIKQQSAQLNNTLADLKNMLQTVPKRTREDENDMKD